MKALFASAVVALLAAPVYADCTYPTPPAKIPDGNTATLDEMITVKKQIKEYDDATSSYLTCIKQEHDDALAKIGDKASDKQKNDLQRVEAEKHNAAIEQLQSVADRFNEQVRAYKARNDQKKD
jgi:hypothetical protein